MHVNGQISLCGFLIGIGIPHYLEIIYKYNVIESVFESFESSNINQFVQQTSQSSNLNTLIYYITITAILAWICLVIPQHLAQLHESIQVFFIAMFLGVLFSIGLHRSLSGPSIWQKRPFSVYICIMSGFHFSEYFVTSITNPSNLEIDSFLLNHSKEYVIAAVISWFEYFIESSYFPKIKSYHNIVTIGLCISVAGDLLRKVAMLTASKNFSHIVRSDRVEGHELVTHGVYSLCRHPSYTGWFLWAVGTQIVLLNPICIVAYAIASWRFFSGRIPYEEATLVMFFGHQYFEYQRRTIFSGIPFVQGYTLMRPRRDSDGDEDDASRKVD